jgi:hypothetical protein
MTRRKQLVDILAYGFTVAMFFDSDSMQTLMNKVYMLKASEWMKNDEQTL